MSSRGHHGALLAAVADAPLTWRNGQKSYAYSATGICSAGGKSAGKWQFDLSTTGSNDFLGICDGPGSAANPLGSVGGATNALSLRNSGQQLAWLAAAGTMRNTNGPVSWRSGDKLTITLDLDASPPRAAIYVNGVLAFGMDLPPGLTWYAAASAYANSGPAVLGAAITYPQPGFVSWV